MKIEDLTKEELIKYIHSQFYQPTQRDMLNLRWESVSGEARRIMAAANEESQKWTGVKTIEALKKWWDAQELFNKGLDLSDKADSLFEELIAVKE